jgi:hypothetical protein
MELKCQNKPGPRVLGIRNGREKKCITSKIIIIKLIIIIIIK